MNPFFIKCVVSAIIGACIGLGVVFYQNHNKTTPVVSQEPFLLEQIAEQDSH